MVETHTLSRGKFLSRVTVTGELEAVQSKLITAPQISWTFGQLKISKLVDDGQQVKKGDLLAQFDKSEVEKALNEAKSNLEIAQSELRKTQAKNKSDIESKEIDLEIARINHQIAKLQLEQAAFKAEIDFGGVGMAMVRADLPGFPAGHGEITIRDPAHAPLLDGWIRCGIVAPWKVLPARPRRICCGSPWASSTRRTW